MASTVLITGCSSGIGLLTARLFAERGWTVAATARNAGALAGLAARGVLTLALDVLDEASIAAAVGETEARCGAIDVLVNNAGYGVFGPLEGLSAEQLERQFRVNVFGAAAMIRHALPGMRARRQGTIINMSSIGGRIATPYFSAYYASKFAIEGLSESLRYELKAHGVRVKLIEPAHFKSDFIDRSLQWATHSAYEPQVSNMRAWVTQSASKAPPADPVAAMILKAATDRSDRLRYPVSGGLMLAIHALLPDAVWRTLVGGGMNRAPKPQRAA